VTSTPPNLPQAAGVRLVRKVAAIVGAVMIVGAGYVIYLFGFRLHPHRLLLGCIIAAVYVVVFATSYSFVYRAQMAAAKRR
jgi:hypothetical protein